LLEKLLTFPADLYAWVVLFILPVNSAVNPLLYTFTTPKYRGQLFKFGWTQGSQRRLVSQRQSTVGNDSFISVDNVYDIDSEPSRYLVP
jgi:hypothetical protein